jgi:hypothetical protein
MKLFNIELQMNVHGRNMMVSLGTLSYTLEPPNPSMPSIATSWLLPVLGGYLVCPVGIIGSSSVSKTQTGTGSDFGSGSGTGTRSGTETGSGIGTKPGLGFGTRTRTGTSEEKNWGKSQSSSEFIYKVHTC